MASARPYVVSVDERALKELAKATKKNKTLAKLLTDALRSLASDRKTDVKRLTGMKPSLYRRRVDNWRIVFAQSANTRSVRVLAIRQRSEDTYEQKELKKFASTLDDGFD